MARPTPEQKQQTDQIVSLLELIGKHGDLSAAATALEITLEDAHILLRQAQEAIKRDGAPDVRQPLTPYYFGGKRFRSPAVQTR